MSYMQYFSRGHRPALGACAFRQGGEGEKYSPVFKEHRRRASTEIKAVRRRGDRWARFRQQIACGELVVL